MLVNIISIYVHLLSFPQKIKKSVTFSPDFFCRDVSIEKFAELRVKYIFFDLSQSAKRPPLLKVQTTLFVHFRNGFYENFVTRVGRGGLYPSRSTLTSFFEQVSKLINVNIKLESVTYGGMLF
jgi:hypothetical protein